MATRTMTLLLSCALTLSSVLSPTRMLAQDAAVPETPAAGGEDLSQLEARLSERYDRLELLVARLAAVCPEYKPRRDGPYLIGTHMCAVPLTLSAAERGFISVREMEEETETGEGAGRGHRGCCAQRCTENRDKRVSTITLPAWCNISEVVGRATRMDRATRGSQVPLRCYGTCETARRSIHVPAEGRRPTTGREL